MDAYTERLWREREPPFDGATAWLMTGELIGAVAAVVATMAEHTPCRTLRTFADWHEHDGGVTESRPADWSELEAVVADEEAFVRLSPEQVYVARAWLCDDLAFYLRWEWFDDEPGGDLDVTASPDVIGRAVDRLKQTVEPLELEIAVSSKFFDARWAG